MRTPFGRGQFLEVRNNPSFAASVLRFPTELPRVVSRKPISESAAITSRRPVGGEVWVLVSLQAEHPRS